MDSANEEVQEWEELMWRYQQPVKGDSPGEKWVLMERILSLKEQTGKKGDMAEAD